MAEKIDKPILINLTKSMDGKIKEISKEMGLNSSAFIRMAIAKEIKRQEV